MAGYFSECLITSYKRFPMAQWLGVPHETKCAQIVSWRTPSPCHRELLKLQLMTFGSCTSLLSWRKNLGRVWHAYIRSSGRFYMLQLISDDSGHFTQPELSLQWSDSHEIKSVGFCILLHELPVVAVFICWNYKIWMSWSMEFISWSNSANTQWTVWSLLLPDIDARYFNMDIILHESLVQQRYRKPVSVWVYAPQCKKV